MNYRYNPKINKRIDNIDLSDKTKDELKFLYSVSSSLVIGIRQSSPDPYTCNVSISHKDIDVDIDGESYNSLEEAVISCWWKVNNFIKNHCCL